MSRVMLIASAMAALTYGAGPPKIAVDELRREYLINPLGLDTHQPRFSWTLTSTHRAEAQSAYQILVATSEQTLSAETGDKWDSGKIASDASVNIAYAGKLLASRERCYWKLRMWDQDGTPSAWSKPAAFEMGLDFADWKGVWIGGGSDATAPLLRKSFTVSKPVKRARAYVSGLGWCELYLNGRKVGDHVLDPAMTNYDKHVLYATYDVTDMLRAGRNALGVMLGNGWYSQPRRLRYGTAPELRLQLDLEYADGERQSVPTDETWRTSEGPITRNGIQMGESYDATLEKPGWSDAGFDDSSWANTQPAAPPNGMMASQAMPAMKVIATRPAAKLTNPKPGVYVYDFGQVLTGWARLRVKGPAGTKVTMKFSERLNTYTGLPDKANHPPPLETDDYILRGSPQGEVWEPRFTFHPFRYVQVEGYPGTPVLASLEGRVVHSAVDSTPSFESSSPLLNKIHNITFWTVQNSLYGMPIDERHREPFAYLEAGETPANLYSRRFMPGFMDQVVP
jgi:alpha-L-rhamnosidase